MARQLTLAAPVAGAAPASMPPGYWTRFVARADVAALGRLYFEAYPTGIAEDTLQGAVADIAASLDGAYGDIWSDGTLVVLAGTRPAAAVFTVWRAPWDDTPDCPFIIELFTAREHRRLGLGRALVMGVMAATQRAGETHVALRVAADNEPALSLYDALGFAAVRAGRAD